MRKRKTKVTLDRKANGRQALMKSLLISLVIQGKMTTTLAKAKAVRPAVERLITHGKVDNVSNRRYLMQRLQNDQAVKKIITTWGPKYATRAGGYTRIMRLSQRVGDAAPQALIEFV